MTVCGRYRDQRQGDGGRRQHDENVHGDGHAAAVIGRDVARPCPESRDERGAVDAGVHAGDESIHGDGGQRRDSTHGDPDAEPCGSAHHVPGW